MVESAVEMQVVPAAPADAILDSNDPELMREEILRLRAEVEEKNRVIAEVRQKSNNEHWKMNRGESNNSMEQMLIE